MSQLIDYAGLFPPAKLPLDVALEEYALHRTQNHAGSLSRFIIPMAKLLSLDVVRLEPHTPIHFSVLARKASTYQDCISYLKEDIARLDNYQNQFSKAVTSDVIEAVVPMESLKNDSEHLHDFLVEIDGLVNGKKRIFFEVICDDDWQELTPCLLKAITNYSWAGLKVRCGGVSAENFPSIQELAFAIAQASEHNVAIKFTAGLHHPLRHFNATVNCKMHGFINVFSASMLTHKHKLSQSVIEDILTSEDIQDFNFENSLSWQDYSLSVEEITHYRKAFAISYGSCSFKEPLEDLEQLNLAQTLA